MSYNFNQLRSTQIAKFLDPITYTENEIETTAAIFPGAYFLDKIINLNTPMKNMNTDGSGYYYLNLKIFKNSTIQNMRIELIGGDNVKTLDTITIPAGSVNEYMLLDFIITPEFDIHKIKIAMDRTIDDYNIINTDGSRGRKIHDEILSVCKIYNVIDSIPSVTILKQIGVQGPSGLKMCIDGEMIRVGKSKIYEINNGINIKYLGFIIEDTNNNDKFFILDYQY